MILESVVPVAEVGIHFVAGGLKRGVERWFGGMNWWQEQEQDWFFLLLSAAYCS